MALLLSFLTAWAGYVAAQEPEKKSAPAATPPAQLVIDLSDGSRIIGIPSADRLKITTSYADLEIEFSKMRAVEFGAEDHAAHVSLLNGDLLNGKLAGTDIAVKTIFGQVTVPLAQVRRIQVSNPGAPLPEGLVLHYTFDADEGGKVTDKSGAGNDGTVQGGAWSAQDRPAGAMKFSGDHQRILVKNSASLQLQDFSIMAWVKLGGRHNQATVAGSGGGIVFGYGQGGYAMGFDGRGHLALTNVGVDQAFVDYGIRDNLFHHIGVTKKGTKVVFYVDGVPRPAPDYNTNFVFDTGVAVAARGDDADSWLLGAIGELEVFNRALSDDEVKGIYDSQKSENDVENAAKPQPTPDTNSPFQHESTQRGSD
ncbi:MAG TPA: LamG domain-containing protein [Chthoniobacteraceae bacterium]|nr:LamG domain-containing protein [Chthoniobacteraceae bacterium]